MASGSKAEQALEEAINEIRMTCNMASFGDDGMWTHTHTYDNTYGGGYIHQPQTPWVQPWNPPAQPTTVDPDWLKNLEPDPCEEEHVLEDIAQYPDGVWGSCKECGERVRIPTIPGGYNAVNIKGFLERVLAAVEGDTDGKLLEELGALLRILESEQEELQLAQKRLEIARQVLIERAS